MTAQVQIIEKNGAGGTATDKTSQTIRFKDADNAVVNDQNKLRVPGEGLITYSYEKWLRLRVVQAPSVDIANIVFYTDAGNGFGAGVALWAKAVAAYATPEKPTGTSGFDNAFDYDSNSPLSLGAGPFNTWGTLPVEIGDHAVLMMTVNDQAGPGMTPAETLIFAFDET